MSNQISQALIKTTILFTAKKWLLGLALAAIIVWLLGIVGIYFFQESLLFYPTPLNDDKKFNLLYTNEIFIEVNNAKIHGLYLKQPAEKSKGIVLFLHGNAGNLETWFVNPEFWLATDYDVLMIDYRGFGKSTGKIQNEAQLHDDVLRAWNFVAKNYPNKKRVIYGRSLGTGLAAHLATQVDADLVVLVSPYQSMAHMAQEYYPWVPNFVLRYPLRTDLDFSKIHMPILLLHGDQDPLISIAQSRYLLKLNPSAQLVEIKGAAHNDIHEFPDYLSTLKNTLDHL